MSIDLLVNAIEDEYARENFKRLKEYLDELEASVTTTTTNTIVVQSAGSSSTTTSGTSNMNETASVSSVASSTNTNLITYTVPSAKTLYLNVVEVSGTNIAKFTVKIDDTIEGLRRTFYGNLNEDFNFHGLKLTAGQVLKVEVFHQNSVAGDFDVRLTGDLQ